MITQSAQFLKVKYDFSNLPLLAIKIFWLVSVKREKPFWKFLSNLVNRMLALQKDSLEFCLKKKLNKAYFLSLVDFLNTSKIIQIDIEINFNVHLCKSILEFLN